MQFSAFLFRRCLFQPRWQISLNAAGTGALNANHRAVFAQRPLHHCQGTKKQVQTELCWLYGPLQIFSGIWEYYVLTHQNERETFYHFSLLSSGPVLTRSLYCARTFGRGFQINIKMRLFWCQAGELFALIEPWQRAAYVPGSAGPGPAHCGRSSAMKAGACTSRQSHPAASPHGFPPFVSYSWAGKVWENTNLPGSETE